MFHARVEHRGKQKSVIGGLVDGRDGVRRYATELSRLRLHVHEQVGGTGLGGRCTVAMLCEKEQRRAKDRGCGRDIKCMVRVTSCADNIALQ